jgi:hypothetical protein
MAKINLRFTKLREELVLCATVKGTSTRHYKVAQNLLNPNYNYWNQKEQRFEQATEEAIKNNRILTEMKSYWKNLLDSGEFSSGKELFSSITDDTATNKEYTFGEYTQKVIRVLKESKNQKPSKNYQLYISLFHALEKEGKIINLPVSDVNNDRFKQFGKWINNRIMPDCKGNNYVGLMKNFSATFNRARKEGLTNNTLSYQYMIDAPTNNDVFTGNAKDLLERGGNVKSITKSQYNKFCKMDLSKIKDLEKVPVYYKELYRDFCILLYELKSRPADIVKLHSDNIAYNEEKKTNICAYIPEKKKNHKQNNIAAIRVSEKAQKIINKYAGLSKGGYILPLKMNDRKWDCNNPAQFEKYNNSAAKFKEHVNKFLHRVGKELNIPFTLTEYAFRRSALTHEIIKGTVSIEVLARTAGTSSTMINKHYLNTLQCALGC